MITTPLTQDEMLNRAVADVVRKEELEERMRTKKPMRIYLGIDPSGAEIHIGHAVVLQRLRDFQLYGHKIILLIGDFTGRVGDPTDRLAERKVMTKEQVEANAKDYKAQASKILDFGGDNPVELRYNSEWHENMTFGALLDLAHNFTVARLLERDMFQKRIKEGKEISLTEFLYPVMQGYDAVMLDADMQVGGSDQLFNILAGRTLMKKLKGKTQIALTFALLEGLDGKKMGKSSQNYVAITASANDMYGKIMSLRDVFIGRYFRLATRVPLADIVTMEAEMQEGANPRDIKARLAREIVTMYHDEKAAIAAEQEFANIFQKGGKPTDIEEKKVRSAAILDVLVETGLTSSKSEARRKLTEGAVRIDDEVTKDVTAVVSGGALLQLGKRKFVKVIVKG